MTRPQPSAFRDALRRSGLLVAVVAFVTACAGTPAATPSIALTVDDANPTVLRGATLEVTVALTRAGGADAPVELSVAGLPAGVDADFAPATLAGGAVASTLTLDVDPAAAEGAFDLTITGTAGTLEADVDLTLTVASLTVTGRVEQGMRQPLGGATVTSQGATTVTDPSGGFTLSGLSVPYDLLVHFAFGTFGLHVYEGMTSATPLLRPTFAAFDIVPAGFGATVTGTLVDGILGVGERVVVCVEGQAIAVSGCDTVVSGSDTYGFGATWHGAPAADVRLHALHFEVDVDDVPTAFLGYATAPLDLADGGAVVADLAFDPVASGTLTGTTSSPPALPNTDLLVFARFGPNLSVPISTLEDPGAAFGVLVPVLPGLTYDVLFVGAGPDGSVLRWTHDVGLDAGAFAVAPSVQLVAPPDAAAGADLTTTFTSTAVGGARTYVWDPVGMGAFFGLTTTRTGVTLPDPTLGGFAFPAGETYAWTVVGHGDDDVDTAAAGGFADFVNLLSVVTGMGGPGFDGDRTLALANEERSVTFAP